VLGLLAVALSGCGAAASGPTLPRALATHWHAQADAVAAALAAHDGCLAQRRAAALQASVIRAVNARRVAPRFQEPLVSAVNDLAARSTCTPTPAPAPQPQPQPQPRHHRQKEHDRHERHEKHEKHGKKEKD
jgi:hypothetical protein